MVKKRNFLNLVCLTKLLLIDEIGKPIEEELKTRAANFKFYALVINECTDSTDTAQLVIFIIFIDLFILYI